MQSVEELSLLQTPKGQSLIESLKTDRSTQEGRKTVQTPAKTKKVGCPETDRSTVKSFNEKSLIQRNRRNSALNV
jgi:hypothetical protein